MGGATTPPGLGAECTVTGSVVVVDIDVVVVMETERWINVGGGTCGGLSGIVMGVSLDVGETVLVLVLEWRMGIESDTEVVTSR